MRLQAVSMLMLLQMLRRLPYKAITDTQQL
jgi:hypothetical protein